MGVSSLYYTLMFGQMQYRYGEIKAISCWNLKISLRSEGSNESEESSIYRRTIVDLRINGTRQTGAVG